MRKLKKIWQSFRYGNRKTKLNIATVAGVFIFSFFCLVMTVVNYSTVWAMIMVFSLVLNLIIIQSLSFADSKKKIDSNKVRNNKNSRKQQDDKAKADDKFNEGAEDSTEDDEDVSPFESMTEESIKSELIKYKVKKEYYPVVIDLCRSEKVKETPAYMWKAGGMVNFLLFEEKTRRISIPAKEAAKITYEPGITAHPAREYIEFKKPSILGSIFVPYMPTYYEERFADRSFTKKNLYTLAPDIMLTNTCVKYAIKLLKADVDMEHVINAREKHSQYYCDAYKLNIFWKDGIIDTKAYKDGLRTLLGGMCGINITYNEFTEYIEEMVRDNLVTREYAQYYIGIMADKRLNRKGKK